MSKNLTNNPRVKIKVKKRSKTVNKAGNYTKPGMRKKIFNRIKAQASHGTGAGKWSASKTQYDG